MSSSTPSTLYSSYTRCPRGHRKNKITKKCLRKSAILREKIHVRSERLRAKLNAPPKRKKCPNGFRQNKQKECQRHFQKQVKAVEI
jgi:hypothetical protein